METLGTLLWWKVGEPALTIDELREHMEQIGMGTSAAPKPLIPIDVFRRLTGPAGAEGKYKLGGAWIRLRLERSRETDTMLTRTILRDNDNGGARLEVGDFVFYKPPRGEPDRARLRVTLRDVSDLPDKRAIERFGTALKEAFAHDMEHLDSQAVRRTARRFLVEHHAIHIDGVYFVPDGERAVQLAGLLEDRVLGGSVAWTMPVYDDAFGRFFIIKAFERAVARREVTEPWIDTYAQIIPITEALREAIGPT